jgi:hypothetical protein
MYFIDKRIIFLKKYLVQTNVSSRAEVRSKFSDQLIEALLGSEFFFLKMGHVVYQNGRLFA